MERVRFSGFRNKTGGKTSACAHMDLCGGAMAAVCDLWANEAVEYHPMCGGTTSAVFAEMPGYDTAAMNVAIEPGHEKAFQASLVFTDRYRSPRSFSLCPDNARARAAALKCGELLHGDDRLRFTTFERDSLRGYLSELARLQEKAVSIDTCREHPALSLDISLCKGISCKGCESGCLVQVFKLSEFFCRSARLSRAANGDRVRSETR